jgi:dTDP-L-rhamnose 4-epimerase
VISADTVVHLAAGTGTGQSLREAARHAEVNVVGTAAMLDAFAESGRIPAHIVLASSRAVYGEGAWRTSEGKLERPGPRSHATLSEHRWNPVAASGEPLAPDASVAGLTEPRPSNVYAATKLAQENILGAWCAGHGSASSLLRFQNVHGPGQSVTNSHTGVLAFFVRTALEGGTIEVFEDGEIIRD